MFSKMTRYLTVFLAILVTLFVLPFEQLLLALLPRAFRRRDITGQIVLVTGGASGIGRLLAIKLASKGAKIVSWDVNRKGNEETAKLIQQNSGKCFTYTVDLCDRNAIYETATKVKKEVGKVDILVNNAGLVTGKRFLDCPDESISKLIDVNLMSYLWTLKAFLPDMIKDNYGHLVYTASLAGYVGFPGMVDYCASKFAVIGLDEALRLELEADGHTGIKTTEIAPMLISTGMFTGSKSPIVPFLEPDYVAEEITDAILMGKQHVVLPKYGNLLVNLKGLATCRGVSLIARSFGGFECMDEFVGREKIE